MADKEWRYRQQLSKRVKSTTPQENQTSRPLKPNVPYVLRNCERLMRLKSANANRRKPRVDDKYKTEPLKAIEYQNTAIFSERGVENNVIHDRKTRINTYQPYPVRSSK